MRVGSQVRPCRSERASSLTCAETCWSLARSQLTTLQPREARQSRETPAPAPLREEETCGGFWVTFALHPLIIKLAQIRDVVSM